MIASRLPILALVVASCVSLRLAAAPPPVVDAPAGIVRGEAVGAIHVFKGIPFALPPTGALRWKPPLPVPRWKDPRDATTVGPACVQPRPRAESIYTWNLPAVSEDCLSLNIWTPASARHAPVFVWIHGGSLTGGPPLSCQRSRTVLPSVVSSQLIASRPASLERAPCFTAFVASSCSTIATG